MENTYKIVRYHFQGDSKVIEDGLTLEQAQAHCNREDTQAEPDANGFRAWFDGYIKE